MQCLCQGRCSHFVGFWRLPQTSVSGKQVTGCFLTAILAGVAWVVLRGEALSPSLVSAWSEPGVCVAREAQVRAAVCVGRGWRPRLMLMAPTSF